MVDLNLMSWNPNDSMVQHIGNVKLVKAKKQEILEELRFRLLTQLKTRIFFLDAHGFNLAQKNPRYLRNLNAAEFVLNEGRGIKMAAKVFRISLKEDLNSAEFIPEVLEIVNEEKMSVYLLGSESRDTEQTAERITANYPDIIISKISEGNFADPIELLNDINKVKPDLLLVGLGVPIQEGWISHYFGELDATLIIAAGPFQDFTLDRTVAADASIRKLPIQRDNLLLLEPKKIFRRYIIENGLFFINIMKLTKKEGSGLRDRYSI